MSKLQRADTAAEAWRALMDLVGSERPPRFPRIAADFELSPMQLALLRILEPGTELPMGALAETLACDASNVTGIVDRLEARELIERRPHPNDRRVKRIAITAEGEALRTEALARLHEPHPGMANLTRSEQRELRDLLRKAIG